MSGFKNEGSSPPRAVPATLMSAAVSRMILIDRSRIAGLPVYCNAISPFARAQAARQRNRLDSLGRERRAWASAFRRPGTESFDEESRADHERRTHASQDCRSNARPWRGMHQAIG